jgi:hypothetical protein
MAMRQRGRHRVGENVDPLPAAGHDRHDRDPERAGQRLGIDVQAA